MTLEEILKSIVSLSKQDLKQLRSQVDFLIGGMGSHSSNVTMGNSSYVREAIIMHAGRFVEVPSQNTLTMLDPHKTNTRLDLISEEILDFGKEYELTRGETLKLCGVLVECAVVRMEEYKTPKSFRTLVNVMSDPKSLLEESFPDYLGTSLFKGFVLKSKNANLD